jgi:hypothetical protein
VQRDVEMPTSGQARPAADKLSASQSDVDQRYLKHATYHRIDVTRRATCQWCAQSRNQLGCEGCWVSPSVASEMYKITMEMLQVHGFDYIQIEPRLSKKKG